MCKSHVKLICCSVLYASKTIHYEIVRVHSISNLASRVFSLTKCLKVNTLANVSQTMSQLVFKVSAFSWHTAAQAFSPFVHCLVDNALFHRGPHFNQALLQIGHINYRRPVHLLLKVTPDFIIDRVQIWAVGRPQIWTDEPGHLVCKQGHCVLCLVCRRAVWKMNTSPAIESTVSWFPATMIS